MLHTLRAMEKILLDTIKDLPIESELFNEVAYKLNCIQIDIEKWEGKEKNGKAQKVRN